MKQFIFKIYRYCFTYVCDEETSTYKFEYYNSKASYTAGYILFMFLFLPYLIFQNAICFVFKIHIPIELGVMQAAAIPSSSILLGEFLIKRKYKCFDINYVEKLVDPNVSRVQKNLFTLLLFVVTIISCALSVFPINQTEIIDAFINKYL